MKSQIASIVCVAACTLLYAGGCGESRDDRRRISQHTKDLAAVIKADPQSENGQAAMKELIGILNGDWSFAQSQACCVLDDLGPLAAPAVPDLMRAATTGDGYVKQDAIRGLRSIGPKAASAVELLIGVINADLSEGRASLRVFYAVEALGNIGEAAQKSIPALERAAGSGDKYLADEAKKALEKLARSQHRSDDK